MGEWQPSKTAPKDGTKFLAYTVHGEYEIGHWYQTKSNEYIEVGDTGLYQKTTAIFSEGWNCNDFHRWMPLPEPPKEQNDG